MTKANLDIAANVLVTSLNKKLLEVQQIATVGSRAVVRTSRRIQRRQGGPQLHFKRRVHNHVNHRD